VHILRKGDILAAPQASSLLDEAPPILGLSDGWGTTVARSQDGRSLGRAALPLQLAPTASGIMPIIVPHLSEDVLAPSLGGVGGGDR
jgi:hypothetical protein